MDRSSDVVDSMHFAYLVEQVRLSYANALKVYMHMHSQYKHLKTRNINDEKLFHLIDHYFYDKSGKISWENIRLLIPINLEVNIKKKYNMLNEREICLCCLLLFDVAVSDIADILPYTQKSIHTITHKIKKKTCMKDIKSNLTNLILNERNW